MPVHHAIALRQGNLDQSTPAGAARTLAGLRTVNGPVRGAHQVQATAVKEAVGLVIHLHGYVGAAVQVGVHLIGIADREASTRLAIVAHLKRYRITKINQCVGRAQGHDLFGL